MPERPVTVHDRLGRPVAAKTLVDAFGNDIIDPNTGSPLIVPLNYDVNAAIAFGKSLVRDALSDPRTNPLLSILTRLAMAFNHGGSQELQRTYNHVVGGSGGEFVGEFQTAASFNLGVVARAAGLTTDQILRGGGVFNRTRGGPDTTGLYGNHPNNVRSITAGAEVQDSGRFSTTDYPPEYGDEVAPASPPMPVPRFRPSRRSPASRWRSRGQRAELFDQDTPTMQVGHLGITPSPIDDAYLRSGEELDRVAIANHGRFDSKAMEDLAIVLDDYNQKGLRSSQALDDLHREVWRIAADETEREESSIPGRFYPQLRGLVEQNLRNAGSDPHLTKALRATGDALDRMFGRSIHPDHEQAWQNAIIARRNAQARMAQPLGGQQEPATGAVSPPWPDATEETTAFGLPPAETVATAAPAQPFGLPPRRPGMFGPGAAKFWNRPDMEPYEMKLPSAATPAVTDEGPFSVGALAPPFPDSAPVAWPSHRTMTSAQLARRYLELTGQAQEPEAEDDPWSLPPWYRRS